MSPVAWTVTIVFGLASLLGAIPAVAPGLVPGQKIADFFNNYPVLGWLIVGVLAGIAISIPLSRLLWQRKPPKPGPSVAVDIERLRGDFRAQWKKPGREPPVLPDIRPGTIREKTIPDSTMSGTARSLITVEYLDGLPTTPNLDRRKLFEKARELEARSEFKEAIPLFQQLLQKPETPSEELALLILIGNCFLNLSQLDEARSRYDEALLKSRRLRNEEAEAAALGNLGIVYFQKGDLDRALEHHQKALKIHEQIGNPLGQAAALGNLGIVYFQKGDLDRALEYYQKALAIHEKIGNPLGQAAALGNLGLVYRHKGDLDKALEHHQKALKIHEQIGNPLGQALDLEGMGLVWAEKGDPVKALQHIYRALAIYEKMGAKLEIERAKGNIAIVEKLKAGKK